MITRFDERPTGTGIAKHSWKSLCEALGAMAPLFLTATAITVGLSILTFVEPHAFRAIAPPRGHADAGTVLIYLAATFLMTVAWAAAAAPVAVATHRFILLGQTTTGIISWSSGYTRSFFLWAVVLRLIGVSLSSLVLLTQPLVFAGVVLIIAEIVMLVIFVHVAMIFPAVATEVPSENWQARIAKSWDEMRGNSWLLVRAGIIAFLPVVAVYILLEVIFLRQLAQGLGDPTAPYNSARLIMGLTFGFLQIPGVALGAALASWTYAWIRQQPAA